MAQSIDPEIQKTMDEMEGLGLNVGTVYKVQKSWPAGTQFVFADGGIFVKVAGVPGAYPLADARQVEPFRSARE